MWCGWLTCKSWGGKKLAFARRQILQQFSTLIVHLYFSSTLSLCTFLKKVPKTWAAVSGIRCFLCSRVALRHLSVGAHLAARCLSQCLGWQELAALKHHATCFQALLGCSLCLPTQPSRLRRGITFCAVFSNSLRNVVARPSSLRGTVFPAHVRTRETIVPLWEEGRAQRREFEVTHRGFGRTHRFAPTVGGCVMICCGL